MRLETLLRQGEIQSQSHESARFVGRNSLILLHRALYS